MLTDVRPPKSESELREWLQNMIWWHHFGDEEIGSVFGMTVQEVMNLRNRLDISVNNRPEKAGGALMVLPYPGGRHPRIGFLDGAKHPQRDTKVSVFAPWDDSSYAVVDLPEALWSNLGLTYLAHQHIPTIWEKQGIELEPVEWSRRADGILENARRLPNGIRFGARAAPSKEAVRMELWLTNGTPAPLSDLRVQVCVLLKGMSGFEQQSNDNKVLQEPFAACRSSSGNRWIITAWEHCDRTWANPPCPCMHSDPRFPDCAPGETQRLHGRLSFYEGTDIQGEFKRLRAGLGF